MNAHEFAKQYEQPYGIDMTIPDQTLTIRQIVDRFAKGLPVEGAKTPIWDEDNDLPDFRTLDLAERQEMAHLYKNELEDIQQRINSTKNVEKNNERVDAVESISGEPTGDF